MGGGSDANHIAALGTPVIDGLGPRGKGFHTHDEFIEVSSLEPKALALIRFLWQLSGLPV
jgi:glutamate carboxypeptidase